VGIKVKERGPSEIPVTGSLVQGTQLMQKCVQQGILRLTARGSYVSKNPRGGEEGLRTA